MLTCMFLLGWIDYPADEKSKGRFGLWLKSPFFFGCFAVLVVGMRGLLFRRTSCQLIEY